MESKKKVLMNIGARTGIKTQTLRMDLRTREGEGKLGPSERVALTYYTLRNVK